MTSFSLVSGLSELGLSVAVNKRAGSENYCRGLRQSLENAGTSFGEGMTKNLGQNKLVSKCVIIIMSYGCSVVVQFQSERHSREQKSIL